jgi:hypothetical protein
VGTMKECRSSRDGYGPDGSASCLLYVQICIMCSCTLGDHGGGGSPFYLFCKNRLSRLMKSRLYAVSTSVSASVIE